MFLILVETFPERNIFALCQFIFSLSAVVVSVTDRDKLMQRYETRAYKRGVQ